jgi:hypothetical protein
MADVAIDVFGCDRSNRSGLGGFVAVGPEGSGVKRSTRPEGVVEGMAIDRHRQRIEHTRPAQTCQISAADADRTT